MTSARTAYPRAVRNTLRFCAFAVSVLTVTLLIAPPRLPAQFANAVDGAAVRTGSIDGSLMAPVSTAGKSVEGVTVTINETGQSVKTDKHGAYSFTKVAPGTYTVIAYADGYSHLRIEDVVVSPDHSVTLSPQAMPIILNANGEIQTMAEFVVHANKDIETMNAYVVEDTSVKPQPFSDRDVDLPRGIDDVQPYYIFNSQTIEESGTIDVESFLRQRLTMDTTVQTSSQVTLYSTKASSGGPNSFTGQAGTDLSSINLNGLGANHTLILVDGLPMAGVSVFGGDTTIAQPGQPDINGIPLSAIDRIEILPSSAGAIYGASAEGGVINIILKKAYSGGDITATYASTWDGYGPSRTLEATFGKSFENGKTQLMITAQYGDSAPMYIGDRVNLINRALNRFQNNPTVLAELLSSGTSSPSTNTYYPPIGPTPNISSLNTGYPVPAGTTGANTTEPIGYITASGLPTTAADPWVLNEAQPLTLKSTGASLGGSNPYIGTIPAGYNGSTPSSIIGGQWNIGIPNDNEAPFGLKVPLANYPRRKSFMTTLSRQMTSKLQLHIDFSNFEDHSYSNYNPLSTSEIIVSATAPINPFNQAVMVSFPVNLTTPASSDTTTRTLTFGGTLKLPFDWIAHLDYQWSTSAFESSSIEGAGTFTLNTPTFYAYSPYYSFNGVPDNNPTPFWSGAINPFVDTLAYPSNWAPFEEIAYATGQTTSNDLTLAASGPLFHLPWGTPRLSIRLDHNKTGQLPGATDAVSPDTSPYPGSPLGWYATTSFGETQTTDSANAELDLPLFKAHWKWFPLSAVDAQINVSNETATTWTGTPGYATFNAAYPYNTYLGSSVVNGVPGFYYSPTSGTAIGAPNTLSGTSPELISSGAQPYRTKEVNSNTSVTGLSWPPALNLHFGPDVMIRFSTASGFVPPTYAQLIPSFVQNSGTTNITDPKTNTQYGVVTWSGGNPNLQPETSKSWDIGGIWEPKAGFLKGFRFDAEFTETKQHNLILSAPGAQFFVNNENLFPDDVIRSASGAVTTIYNVPVNVAEAKSDAWNFNLDYQWKTAVGSFDLMGAETIEEHDEQQIVANTQFLEYVGYPNSGGVAKTKTNGTLRWANRNWVAAWTVVYYDGYKQYGTPGDPGAYASQLESKTPYNLNTHFVQLQGGYTIPSQLYHNLYLGYTFHTNPFNSTSRLSRWADVFLNKVSIHFNVNNVFNTLPPFDAWYAPFYTSPFGDIQLRNYSISIKKSF